MTKRERLEKNRIAVNKANILFSVYMDTYPDAHASVGDDGILDIHGAFSRSSIGTLQSILNKLQLDGTRYEAAAYWHEPDEPDKKD